ncbi:hypothetical protein L9W92_10570 [Pelotomaculum terephthalicicum JT]|uniref:hypothetical protein n=1 Tax=Pelotomaculum TaxID=191373 RepID=UPI0009CE426A|nr:MULTISPECIES: hypothetical protein [Pelotomaculum]MCG9968495.1 hypothetical protein [Pelotomaculum terephthalicicum JT]OPX85064.1 MAG: hypothetical protein A4E54_02614 [Pelotomaculum sp. PtaB.Bin117]
MDALRTLVHEVIQIELQQIKHLAMLGCMAPDEFTRHIILGMIMEEAGEAKFWNTVDAAYRGVQVTGGETCPGMQPGMAPTSGWCPTPGCPPGMAPTSGWCPTPGCPPGMPPGMAPTSGWCPAPGCTPCPGTPGPGMPTGGLTGGLTGGFPMPAWNPNPIMPPGTGDGDCGCGQGFYSEEAKKDEPPKDEKK